MSLQKPKLLVLDGQGVVFDAPIKRFLSAFARRNDLDYSALLGRWQDRLRQLAWSGEIDDETLWTELAGKDVDVHETMLELGESYRPGPAACCLDRWSQHLPIWLLSNHRSHWVLPQLVSMNLAGVFERLLISDETGIVKPDPQAFAQLLNGQVVASDILFVDDQLHNTQAAEELGLRTVHASPGAAWAADIDAALGNGK